MRHQFSVLIVGGGPVGLALAADLGWRGVRCLLVEQTDGVITHPKANGVNSRTMEFCRRWGITKAIRDTGFPNDYPNNEIYVTSLAGHLLACEEIPTLGDRQPPPGAAEKYQRIPQTIFDPILRDLARSFPTVSLRYRLRCNSVTLDTEGVTAQLTDLDRGNEEQVWAQYVVSCEGANSSIREALGIKMEGTEVLTYASNILFRAPNLLTLHDKGPGRSYVAIGPNGPWASLIAINGKDLWRLQIRGSRDPKFWDTMDVDESIRRFAGMDFPYEVLSEMQWVRRELVAKNYRKDRIFIAGDAAHQLSPSGSFGMNTGVGDAMDLSWKLQAVLDGWGGSNLLDSYEIERRPIGVRNVQEATVNFTRIGAHKSRPEILDNTPEGERARKEAGDRISKVMERSTAGIELGYRYENSPICVPDGTPPPPDDPKIYTPTARPGSRAPHVSIDGNKSVLDLYGRSFVLLRLGSNAPSVDGFISAADKRGMPLEAIPLDMPELSTMYERKLVLVRPDGHVAWRGDSPPNDCEAVIDRVRGAAI